MSKILKVKARQIFDSRGNPTVEAEVFTKKNSASAICPSGASTGTYEAYEKRDKTNKRYLGKSVLKPVSYVNKIVSKRLKNLNVHNQEKIDHILIKLDGTKQKSKIGANAILAISMAAKKLSAKIRKIPLYKSFIVKKNFKLPYPLMNIINGGAHANNGLDIQEFMIVPAGFDSFSESLRAGVEIFHNLKDLLNKNSHSTAVGDEGGFAPDLKSNEEALSFISEAVSNAGYKLGSEVYFALDVAATEIYKNKKYRIDKKDLNVEEISIYYQKLIDKYPIISIEDPLDEDDWDGWAMLTNLVGDKVQLVGDDLFVTNNSRLQTGIDKSAGNSILIKINQIGSISETLQAIDLAKKNNYSYIISHRSGETEDAIIADISVATNSGQIKTGSCSRTDRTAKYNQLLRIEDSLGKKAKFAKLKTFNTIA